MLCFGYDIREWFMVMSFYVVLRVCRRAECYSVERTETLMGRKYVVVAEQPFFRVYHEPHFKVSIPDGLLKRYLHGGGLPTAFLHPPPHDSSDGTSRKDGRSQPAFGVHHLPNGENTNQVIRWPTTLQPYLLCSSLICQCPLYNGTLESRKATTDTTDSNTKCLLPSGRQLQKVIRKEYRTYTDAERNTFIRQLRQMKNSGLYNQLGLIHRRSGVHAGPGFFPWHREFLKRFEMAFRLFNPESELGLPYWDSTMDNNLHDPADSLMFTNELMGDMGEGGMVYGGPFGNWATIDGRPTFQRNIGVQADGELLNDARIDFVLNQTQIDRVLAYSLPLHECIKYKLDDRFLEYSHDYLHYFVGGDMLERYSSSNDPLFLMHHSFIDFIWEMWRQQKQTRAEREQVYPPNNPYCMPVWHFSHAPMTMLEPLHNADALSNAYTDNLFEYAPRPVCLGGRSMECGNTRFLFCDHVTDPDRPKCTVKVRRGGSCVGFEWSSEACYVPDERCVNGKCVAVPYAAEMIKETKEELFNGNKGVEIEVRGAETEKRKEDLSM